MEKRNKILTIAIVLSIIFHLGIFILLDIDWLFLQNAENNKKSPPQEVSIVFPENKPTEEPRLIVENMNENEVVPERSNYLSDKNSQARNRQKTDNISKDPNSKGNSPFANLSTPLAQKKFKDFAPNKFSTKAITGETFEEAKKRAEKDNKRAGSVHQDGSGQNFQQQDFSVEELGSISLSTYAWEWAPYVNKMKKKLHRVWYPPTAYSRLGLIHGYTVIKYTINREGKLTQFKVLKHKGHESLEVSSSEAIKALFPFLPLPDSFPEEHLTITAKLFYPNLRQGR